MLCYDAFAENKTAQKMNFLGLVLSGAVEVFAAVYFQFFTKINFDSVENTVAFIKSRTNLEVSDFAIQLEYFGSMKYSVRRSDICVFPMAMRIPSGVCF